MLLLPMVLSAFTRWQVAESENFRLVYPRGYEDQARHAVSWLETERENINTLTGWDPGKVWVVIEDVGMGVNGFANPVGSEIHLFTTPPWGLDISTRDWMRSVGVHEYTHISSIQPVYGLPRILKFLFGPWVLPNALVPGWMIEGVTVYYESQVEPYEGRLEAGFFDANLLTRTSQGMFPKRWEMDGSLTQFPGGAIYAYGGPFFEWLVDEKGPQTVSRFYARNGRNLPYFFMDGAARKSFGERFPQLLSDWKAATYERALAFVPADSAARRLSDTGWYVSNLTSDGERIYYVRSRYLKPAAMYVKGYTEIIALDPETGEEEVILRPNTSVQMLRVHDGVLYYTTATYRRGFANTYNQGFGEVYELRSYDLSTGREEKIYEGRIRAFEYLPSGSFLLSVDKPTQFGSDLIIVNTEGKIESLVGTGGLLVAEIVFSGDGELYVVARRQGEHWDIYKEISGYLLSKWKNLTSTPWAETGLSINQDGDLLYSANPDGTNGRVGIYLYDPSEQAIEKVRAPSYAVLPVMVGNQIIFTSLNPSGYDLYSVPLETSSAEFFSLPPDTAGVTVWQGKTITYDKGFISRSSLRPYLSLFRPWARIPYVWPSFDDAWNLTNLDMGVFLLGADVVGENSYQANVSYDAVTNTNTVDFGWINQRFAPLTLNLDYSHNPMWDTLGQFVGYNYRIYPSFNYPLYYHSGRGLNVIRWGEGFRTTGETLQDRTLVSNISLSFSWPFWRIGIAASHQWESPIFSANERSWLLTRAAATTDLAGGFLLADVSTFADLSAQLPVGYTHSASIRGYAEIETADPVFATATLEYRHRLLKMRFGLWNPNVFFEDLYVNVFTDAAFDTQELLGASAGLELSPEVHLFWGNFRIAPVVGVSLNLEGKINPHGGVSTSLPVEILRSRKDAAGFAADPWPVTLSSTKAELLEPH